MPFRKYVEVGRLAVVNFGPDYGLPVLISDIVDQNRVSSTPLLQHYPRLPLRSWSIIQTSPRGD